MSILSPNSHLLYREVHHKQQSQQPNWSNGCLTKAYGFGFDGKKMDQWKKTTKRDCKVEALWDFSRPESVEMEPIINDVEHLELILEKAKQASQPIIIDWHIFFLITCFISCHIDSIQSDGSAWCRKCIYLKPKLEKLGAEFDTKLKIYSVDVNKVPQTLVKRGNITKMPTIQLWKDGEMKAEAIKGGFVIEEVREMIQNNGNSKD